MRWGRFAEAAPELAALGHEGFGDQNLCLLGTLRRDGRPRISANEGVEGGTETLRHPDHPPA